jgi:hypothetical protein
MDRTESSVQQFNPGQVNRKGVAPMNRKLSMAKFGLVLGAVCLGLVPGLSAQSATVTVFATGLNNPRGLKFGPKGVNLFVAEGGTGGTRSTIGKCEQAPGPPAGPGPYTGGFTARISKISPKGVRTTVAAHLPSSQTNPAIGSLVSGVADVAFIGNTLYALKGGAGCSHGLLNTNNGVLVVNPDGSWKEIANLSAFQKAHPVAHPEADDFEPDGTWYSMVASGDAFYAIEPNHGELDKIDKSGKITRVVDISASQGHIVPTAMIELLGGIFLISNLDTFPITPGSSSLFVATKTGSFVKLVSGFTAVLGLAARNGKIYVLEMSNVANGPAPHTGDIVSVDLSGHKQTVASGLDFPTGMTFGPDANLYVSNKGFGFGPGEGEILKITLH